MASVFEPLAIISRCAARVSAVSPDWVMSRPIASGSAIGIAVAVLAGVVDIDREPRQPLDHELAGERRRASWCRRRRC